MNREDSLAKCLASWVPIPEVGEIIVVDWCSKNPLIDNLNIKNIFSDKIKILRVEDEVFFSLPKSYNLAYSHTNSEYKILMKLDADYESIDPSWLQKLNLKDKELDNYFLTGDYRTNKEHSGFLLVNKKDFVLFNENFEGWGFHDQYIYELIKNNSDHVLFSDIHKYIKHIPHSYGKRVKNYQNKDMFDTMKKNREIAIYNKTFIESQYVTQEQQSNYIILKRLNHE